MIRIGKAKAESAQDNLASFRISNPRGRRVSSYSHAASFAIHLLLLAAIISLIVHLVRGRSVAV